MPTRERRAKQLGIPVEQLPDNRGKGPKAKGPKHPRWNKGKIVSSHGYVKVRVGKEHPLADPNGYAYEHLIVWMSAGGQLPGHNEVIHHRNGDKTDNRINNLTMINRYEHGIEHGGALPDDKVIAIRERYAAGEDGTALAAEFGIPVSRTYRLIRGETRKEAGGPIATGCLRGKKAAGRLLDGVEYLEVPE